MRSQGFIEGLPDRCEIAALYPVVPVRSLFGRLEHWCDQHAADRLGCRLPLVHAHIRQRRLASRK